MDNITTIQIRENVKMALERLKERRNESYEEVIVKLLMEAERKRKNYEELMIEAAKETAEESLRITKEFEAIDEDFDWEWRDN